MPDLSRALAAIPPALRSRIAVVVASGALAIAGVLVQNGEGRSYVAYRDIAGIVTVCDGHTGNVRLDHTYTDAECDALRRADLGPPSAAVRQAIHIPLNPLTEGALIDFAYNVGPQAFKSSTLVRRLNAGEGAPACEEIMRYVCYRVSPGSGDRSGTCKTNDLHMRQSRGLVNRRLPARALCIAGFEGAVE